MNRVQVSIAIALAALSAGSVRAATPAPGERYQIVREIERKAETGAFGSSSSFDRDTIDVRVVTLRDDGVELEYTEPEQDQAPRGWQFPARVFHPAHGAAQLINQAEIAARIDPWLASAGWNRAQCGKWIFTWNAFKIECDPASALGIVNQFDIQPADLADGAAYGHPGAADMGRLKRSPGADGGATYQVTLPIDRDAVRRQAAQSDVVVGQITGNPVSEKAALAARAKMQVSGTIAVTFKADGSGTVQQRTVVVTMQMIEANGRRETSTSTEVMVRRPL